MKKFYNYKITSYNASFSLDEYSRRYTEKCENENDTKKAGQFYAPFFQRNDVWDDKKQSKLIETFLIKLPVPPVFLFKKENGQHEIIDGYQRIKSIHDFISGKLKLKGLDTEYNGKYFKDLTRNAQEDFLTKMLNCVMIENMDSGYPEALYEIFSRLNSGGMKLQNMEIRRALGWGRFLSDIENFAKTQEWRKLWGTESKPKRYEDIELLLRILSLNETLMNQSMKDFLNKYLENNKNADKTAEFEKLKNAINTILNCYKSEKPFHKGSRVNYALVDSILPTIMKNPTIENIGNKIEKLISKTDGFDSDKQKEECHKFRDICFKGQGSISKNAVNERRRIAEEILKND